MSKVLEVRSQYRMQEWAKIIHECEASGLSNKELCERNGVSIKSYYYWLRKLRETVIEHLRTFKPNLRRAKVPNRHGGRRALI